MDCWALKVKRRRSLESFFYILLKLHLDVILVNDQLEALFSMYLHVFHAGSLPTGTQDSYPLECITPDDVLTQFDPPDNEHLLLETCSGVK